MAVDLKNRPDEDTGDNGIHPDWYKPGSDPLEDRFNAHSASDSDLPEGHPSRSGGKAASGDDLAEAEASGATPSASAAEKSEQAATRADDTIGGGFKNEGKRKGIRGRITRKQGITGGIIGLLVGGGFGILSIVQGPLQIVSLSNLLSNTFFSRNNSTSDTSVRRIYNTISGQREKNRLSPLASALATKNLERLRTVGIDPNFETPNGKGRAKIQSLRVDPSTPEGERLLARAVAGGFNPPNTGPIDIPLRGRDGGRLARSLSEEMIDIAGKKGIAASVSKRRLKRLFGVNYHPLNIAKRTGESINDYLQRRRSERAQEVKEGTRSSPVGDAVGSPDEEGNPNQVDGNTAAAADDIQGQVDDINNTSDPVERKSKLQTLRRNPIVRAGAGGAIVVALTCAVKDVGNNVQAYKMTNVIKPLIRLTVQVVAAGSQTQAMQDINLDELRGVTEPLYDEETETSAFGAAPLVAATGGTGGTELDPAVKSQIVGAYNADKPELFNAIDSVPFIGVACGANNWFGDLPIVKQIGEASNAVLSGLSSITTGKSIDEWMGDLVAILAGDAIDVLAEGGQLGGLLGYGGLLTSNASAIPAGGVQLDQTQAYEWRQYLEGQKKLEMRGKSIADRLFDLDSTDSLASKALLETAPYTSDIQSITTVARTSFSMLPAVSESLSRLLVPRVASQAVHNYDYGIPEFGIPLSQLNSSRYEDIYENIDRLEDNDFTKLKEANEKWGKCFGDPLDDSGNIIDKEVEDYEDIRACEDDYGNAEFQDYQMYILDNVTIKSLACYEGIDEQSCNEIGFGSTTASTAATDQPVVGNTANVPCAAGTTDVGEADGYSVGQKYLIRLCEIPGFTSASSEDVNGLVRVNSTVSGKWLQLYQQAQTAGINLTANSSFRTMSKQINLYGCYKTGGCNNGNEAAKPGYSNHQIGFAVDIDIAPGKDPTLTTCRANPDAYPVYKWLAANAPPLGIDAKVTSECWHWSVGGK